MANRRGIKRAAIPGLALIILGGLTLAAKAEQPSPADLADALNGVFGKHPHTRTSHAKGFCVAGSFTPSPDAAALSKAPHFARPVPLIGRFSLGGGNPQAADNGKNPPRGLALRLDAGDGVVSDFALISAPVFVAKTPAAFVEFLKVRTPAPGAEKPDPAGIEAYSQAHPESTRQAAYLNERPVPASYGSVDYWGVHAFTLTNEAGEAKLVKLKAIPAKGAEALSDEEAKAKGPNFYEEEMKGRLAAGPVSFDLVAILGQEGDPTDDPTTRWQDEDQRDTAPLGKIEISALAPAATCDAISFLPATLAEGIAGPANDLIYQARSGAYLVSLTRRNAP